ncbi:MAG: sugar transferase [Ilumatobacteraceae bacterium]
MVDRVVHDGPGERTQRLTAAGIKRRLVFADAAALVTGCVVALAIQQTVRPVASYLAWNQLVLLAASLPGFAFGAAMSKLHLSRANERPADERRNVIRTVLYGVAVMVLLAFGFQVKSLSRLWVLLVAVCTIAALLLERSIARRAFNRLRSSGALSRRILIIGTDVNALRMLHMYERNPALGYKVVGLVGDEEVGVRGGVRVLGPVDELDELLLDADASGVVISLNSIHPDAVNSLTRRLTDNGFHVALSSSLSDIDVTRLRPQSVDGSTLMYIEPVIRNGWRAQSKRLFDVVAALSILVVTLPFWLVSAIAIRLDSSGPVFFRQERVGRGGKSFTMTKFRTMSVDAHERRHELAAQNKYGDGPLFKLDHDPRITRVGRFLRKTSIDELPQLINVLRGEMSMVGPRPALPSEVEEWDVELRDRLRVLPGLTGMWQVFGRSGTSFAEYRRLDLYYVDNWSLAHDLRICLRTIGVVLTGKGAS